LELVRGNMTVLNEMLSELVPGKEDESDVQLLTVTSLKIYILIIFKTISIQRLFQDVVSVLQIDLRAAVPILCRWL